MFPFWPLIVASGLLIAAAIEVQSYVVPKDPNLIYLAQARQIVESGWDLNLIRGIGRWLTPGYPLLLAGAIELFGAYAVAWVNLLFGLLFFVSLSLLLRHLLHDSLAYGFGLAGVLLLLFFGYVNNIHFHIYLFRDLPPQALVSLAMALSLIPRKGQPPGRVRLVIAGIILLLAASIREMALASAVGLCLWMLMQPENQFRDRCRRLAWLLSPFFAVTGLLILLMLISGSSGGLSGQVPRFLGRLQQLNFDALPQMIDLARLQLDITGIILLALGLLAALRSPALWLLLVMPAILNLLLYGTWKYHPRYVYTSLLWISPLTGLWIGILAQWLKGRRRSVAMHIALAGLFLLLATALPRLEPWFDRVDYPDVSAFRKQVHKAVQPGDFVVMEKGGRFAAAALFSYTRARRVDPGSVSTLKQANQRVLLMLPANKRAIFVDSVNEMNGMRTWEILRSRYSLRTVLDVDGKPLHTALAGGTYRFYEVATHDQRQNESTIGQGAANRLLVLDNTTTNPLQCVVSQASTRRFRLDPGLSLLRAGPQPGTVRCTSTVDGGSVPDQVLLTIVDAVQPVSYRFDDQRISAVGRFIDPTQPGWVLTGMHARHQVGLVEHPARLRIPIPKRERGHADIDFLFKTATPLAGPARLEIRTGEEGAAPITFPIDLGQNWIPVALRKLEYAPDRPLTLTLRLIGEGDDPPGMFLHAISVLYRQRASN